VPWFSGAGKAVSFLTDVSRLLHAEVLTRVLGGKCMTGFMALVFVIDEAFEL
jgi:hypothetical protein